MCLLGGWAVYSLVNDRYREYTGREYIGSKDIDIGFHIDPSWNENQLYDSTIFSVKDLLVKEYRFKKLGPFRYAKWFDNQSGDELTEHEARIKPMYNTFILYIDILVDYYHAEMQQILGFHPIDEPLLRHVFSKPDEMLSRDISGIEVNLPNLSVLLAMKLNALPRRREFEKRVKDISDSYVLARFTDISFKDITRELHSILNQATVTNIISSITGDELENVADLIDIDSNEINTVLKRLTG